MANKPWSYWELLEVVGLPIILPAAAVALGTLKPLHGAFAALILCAVVAVGECLGRFLFSSVHKGVRGIIYWLLFGIAVGIWSGIELSAVWGALAGALFGVSLGVLLVVIGYREFKSAENAR